MENKKIPWCWCSLTAPLRIRKSMQWEKLAILSKVYIRRYSILLVTYMLTTESCLSVELLVYVL